MPSSVYPLLFKPVYKTYIWAGQRLAGHYHRSVPEGRCSESWEISDRREGMSVVENGPLAGQSFLSLIEGNPKAWLGQDATRFPLLVKIIDAGDALSLQVHPDEKSAKLLHAEPKTEMWYALESDHNAYLYAGFKAGTRPDDFESALKGNTLESLLQRFPARAGSSFFIPAGRIHAIGKGCLLLEVQQNSDTTYRIFDWNRRQPDGTLRALHTDSARQCIRWDDPRPTLVPAAGGSDTWVTLAECPFFHVSRNDMSRPLDGLTGGRFHVLFTESGGLLLETGNEKLALPEGRTCLVPAAITRYRLIPSGKRAAVVRITGGGTPASCRMTGI